mmetsp:Transcript_108647/g.291707  ORF Transcript_108647/g.291707 Transcript_108647/m.291707 type:complete len:161 (+) Transcript_108647:88-570(+)
MSGSRPAGGMEAMVGRVGMKQTDGPPPGGGLIVDNRPPPPANIDAGVHPAVAAMRASGARKACMPALDPSTFGMGRLNELSRGALAHKRVLMPEPAGQDETSTKRRKGKKSEKKSKKPVKKKEKKSRDKKRGKKKEKKKQSSISSSSGDPAAAVVDSSSS